MQTLGYEGYTYPLILQQSRYDAFIPLTYQRHIDASIAITVRLSESCKPFDEKWINVAPVLGGYQVGGPIVHNLIAPMDGRLQLLWLGSGTYVVTLLARGLQDGKQPPVYAASTVLITGHAVNGEREFPIAMECM